MCPSSKRRSTNDNTNVRAPRSDASRSSVRTRPPQRIGTGAGVRFIATTVLSRLRARSGLLPSPARAQLVQAAHSAQIHAQGRYPRAEAVAVCVPHNGGVAMAGDGLTKEQLKLWKRADQRGGLNSMTDDELRVWAA